MCYTLIPFFVKGFYILRLRRSQKGLGGLFFEGPMATMSLVWGPLLFVEFIIFMSVIRRSDL